MSLIARIAASCQSLFNESAIDGACKRSQLALDLLQEIARRKGKALLFVTHTIIDRQACDWIHEMKDSRIVASHRAVNASQCGRTSDLFS